MSMADMKKKKKPAGAMPIKAVLKDMSKTKGEKMPEKKVAMPGKKNENFIEKFKKKSKKDGNRLKRNKGRA